MSKVKGPFAPIRVGLIEHMHGIKPMECKVYLTAHLLAVREGKDRGKVFISKRHLAKLTGHKWDSVKRSIVGLEEKDYLKPIEGGWQILNFNGDNPANTLSQNGVYPKKGYTPKKDKSYPKMGEGGTPKRDNNLSQNGRGGTTKTTENKKDTAPLDVRRNKKTDVLEESKPKKAPTYPIYWNQKEEELRGVDCPLCEKGDWSGRHESCGLQKLKDAIRKLYAEEFGGKWLAAIWASVHDWIVTHSLPPEEQSRDPTKLRVTLSKGGIREYKDLGSMILGWYLRSAKEERKKE